MFNGMLPVGRCNRPSSTPPAAANGPNGWPCPNSNSVATMQPTADRRQKNCMIFYQPRDPLLDPAFADSDYFQSLRLQRYRTTLQTCLRQLQFPRPIDLTGFATVLYNFWPGPRERGVRNHWQPLKGVAIIPKPKVGPELGLESPGGHLVVEEHSIAWMDLNYLPGNFSVDLVVIASLSLHERQISGR